MAISIEASRVRGCSSKLTTLRKEGCFFVFSRFTSLGVKEKKATSLPDTKKDSMSSTKTMITNMVVVAGEMNSNLKQVSAEKVTEW
ncbi:MAG TPA: hypothetical protein DHV17_08380 [Chitinophagaceae bacterium]|nr:hypothetical protein [Chitinophagaceae bacterium]